MQPSVVLPLSTPLILTAPISLRPDVKLWCVERLDGEVSVMIEPEAFVLVFESLDDCLKFSRRWL